MKKENTRRFLPILLVVAQILVNQTIKAQVAGTNDDGFVVRIIEPASIAQTLRQGNSMHFCQWVGQEGWGPDLTEDLCGEVVWAEDSLACGPLTNGNAFVGKIALIRRGNCSFSLKTYWAQQAGAIAVIILNDYDNPQDGPCATYVNNVLMDNMTGADSAASVFIPAIFLERSTSEAITEVLANGETLKVCFSFERMSRPTSASSFATPILQVDTMEAITVMYHNRSGLTQTDVQVKAEIFNPMGSLVGTMVYNLPICDPGVDSLLVFPPFYAPPALGKHKVVFSNNQFTEPRDTVYSYFAHTRYTFATDNLVLLPDGAGPDDAEFANNGFFIQSGSLIKTNDNMAYAQIVSFGISNVESVLVPGDPAANIIGIAIYKADLEGDGNCDLSTSFLADLGPNLVCYEEYVMNASTTNYSKISVDLTYINTGQPSLPLEPNTAYYVTLIYDGTAAGLGVGIRFWATPKVDYASLEGCPTSPIFLGQLYPEGWKDVEIIQRLQLEENFFLENIGTQEPQKLDDSKLRISPNPASSFVNVELKLAGVNPSVSASILGAQGRTVVGSQVQKNFQNGVMNLDVHALPAGVYYVWVRTAEGSAMKQISVAH